MGNTGKIKDLLNIICLADGEKINAELEQFINKYGQKSDEYIILGENFREFNGGNFKIKGREKRADYIFYIIVKRELEKNSYSCYESVNIVKQYEWFDSNKFLNPDYIPDQRWHWIQYIMYKEIVNGERKKESEFKKIFYEETGKNYDDMNNHVRGVKMDDSINRIRIYCPEQLLWLAKAVEVEKSIVDSAMACAEKKINEIRNESPDAKYSAEATKKMNKETCLWNIILEKIDKTNN